MQYLLVLSALLLATITGTCNATNVVQAKVSITDMLDNLVGVVRECSRRGRDEGHVWACFKVKAISGVDNAVRNAVNQWQERDIQITDNVVLARTTGRSFVTNLSSTNIVELVSNFLESRTLQIQFPRNLANNVVEARGKLKKMGAELLAAMLMMKGTMAAMALGALALIAGKALTLSMLAMLLSIVSALKKASSGGHDNRRSGRRADQQVAQDRTNFGQNHYEQWNSPNVNNSQELAYSAYKTYQ